jgi:ABC-2 type transport system permease protein
LREEVAEALWKAGAAVWVQVLRVYRMRVQLLDWALVDVLWLLLIIYAVLAFTDPADYPVTVPVLFWSMVAWSLMSTPVWAIGNWVKAYIALGMLDENEMAGMSHRVFLASRILPSLAVGLIASAIAASVLYASTGVWPVRAERPLALVASLAAIALAATLYSLSLSWLGMRLGLPAPLLDVMNIALFVGGGVAVNVEDIPWPLRLVALATPYSHPAEIMRYAVAGDPPYLGLKGEAAATLMAIAALTAIEAMLYREAMRNYRKRGPRGVGVT